MNELERPSILLIIDDDEVLRELLPLLLAEYADSILTAETGQAAITMVAGLSPEQRPSIVLADLQMPGLPATALAENLRRFCPPHAHFIAMSGSNPIGAAASGFEDFLGKPFTADDFGACLRSLSFAVDADETGPRLDPIDATIFRKLVAVMGEQPLAQVYSLFLEDAAVRFTRMRTAARERDAASLVRDAHAMKGSCGMLGATELHNLAGRIESGGLEYSFLLKDFGPAIDRLRRMLDQQTVGSSGARQEVVQN